MRIPAEVLKKNIVDILTFFGESPKGAELVADSMVKAEARGIGTHGTYLLRPIADRVKAGQLSLPTAPEFIMDDGAVAVIDGKNGLGPVAGHLAVGTAVEKAKKYGIGMVLIRNTNNMGALAYYAQAAADSKMIAVISCNAAPSMAPWGGADPFIGTNPISISIPTRQNTCFTVDMASSVVARGKIRKAQRQNARIPDHWALDKNGVPTTDPNEAMKGTLLPMGGPKGSALALAVDILSGLLAGSSYGPDIKSFHTPEGPTGVGASVITIDIGRFMAFDKFEDLLGAYIASAKNLKKAEGVQEIYMPGEIESAKEQNSLAQGIELDESAIKSLDGLLAEIGSDTRLGS
jgi:LDH2 family malate/lactate/ureidoglycolate dehydrogenase